MEFKNTLLATSAAVALCASSAAHADSYFTVFGGATFQSDLDARGTYTATKAGLTGKYGFKYVNYAKYLGFDASAELESGFVLGAAYGRNLNPSWRMELEMAYRENQVEQSAVITGATKVVYASFSTIKGYTGYKTVGPKYTSGTTGIPVEGSTSFFSVMANVWYDFSIAGPWETFLGAGIGMAQANVNDFQIGYGTKAYDIADGSDWVFAYQFGVGAGYTLDNGIRLSAQYRYFGTDEVEIDGVNLQGEANEFLFGISFPLGN